MEQTVKKESINIIPEEVKNVEETITENAGQSQGGQQNTSGPESGINASTSTASSSKASNTAASSSTTSSSKASNTAASSSTTSSSEASNTGASSASSTSILQDLANLSAILKSINDIRETLISLELSEADKIYYDRSVRPLLEYINLLGFASSSLTTTAINFQGSFVGRKKEIKQALDLSHDINKQLECIFQVLKERTCKYLDLENGDL